MEQMERERDREKEEFFHFDKIDTTKRHEST
jgi:hypothetical protein